MSYTAETNRANPTCFLFLIDQSGSMKRTFATQPDRTLAQGAADAANILLRRVVRECSNGEVILDRYAIGVIGYGNDVSLGFSGELAGGCLQWVSEVKVIRCASTNGCCGSAMQVDRYLRGCCSFPCGSSHWHVDGPRCARR